MFSIYQGQVLNAHQDQKKKSINMMKVLITYNCLYKYCLYINLINQQMIQWVKHICYSLLLRQTSIIKPQLFKNFQQHFNIYNKLLLKLIKYENNSMNSLVILILIQEQQRYMKNNFKKIFTIILASQYIQKKIQMKLKKMKIQYIYTLNFAKISSKYEEKIIEYSYRIQTKTAVIKRFVNNHLQIYLSMPKIIIMENSIVFFLKEIKLIQSVEGQQQNKKEPFQNSNFIQQNTQSNLIFQFKIFFSQIRINIIAIVFIIVISIGLSQNFQSITLQFNSITGSI
ncbi:unnamed protein product [Paramecium pentaurelia]|uniref:Transmembrane protein n=1 Tax=Paramecium pentaurelia TaxID=43138 RepID=A0A8S1UCU6_9CILI|nr:unnamed protein product [Paramecium pentaurelia]